MTAQYLKQIERKLETAKNRYKEICLRISRDFERESKTECFSAHLMHCSDIHEISSLSVQIRMLSALVNDLKTMNEFEGK